MDGEGRADLLVVGAGPAGMGAAYYAARLGLRVVLLERERLPRDRTCGDGMLPQTVSEMEMLGLGDWLANGRHGVVEGFSIRTRTARFDEPLPPGPRGARGYVVRRREFEPKILERVLGAGATVRDGVEVGEVLRSSSGEVRGVEATGLEGEPLRFEAPVVAMADGSAGRDEARGLGSMVVSTQYFRGVQDPGAPGRTRLHVWYTEGVAELGVGYGRIFLLGDGSANVGFGVHGRNLPGRSVEEREAAVRRMHEGFLGVPEVAMMLDSAEPEGPVRSRTFRAGGREPARHEAGILRVGDAGAMAHPVSGEGIGFALQAGRMAAGWTLEAHRRRDFSAALLSGYARQVKGLQSLRHPSTQALVALVDRLPGLDLMQPVLKECETDPALRRTVVRCLIGEAPATSLLYNHPATSVRTLGAAIRKALQRT